MPQVRASSGFGAAKHPVSGGSCKPQTKQPVKPSARDAPHSLKPLTVNAAGVAETVT